MRKLACDYCGAPIEKEKCRYCGRMIDSEKMATYNKCLQLLEQYNNTIKPKLYKLETITQEDNSVLMTLLENEMFDMDSLDITPIIYSSLRGKKIVEYKTFELAVKRFVEETMKTIFKTIYGNYTDKIEADVEDLGDGLAGKTTMHYFYTFDKEYIEKLYNGSTLPLFVLFHEMSHGLHDILISNGLVSDVFLNIMKDRIIREDEVARGSDYYYRDNYENLSCEIYAQEYAVKLTHLVLDIMHLSIDEDVYEDMRSRFGPDINNQNRITRINGEKVNSTIDEIFDNVIVNHPELLDNLNYKQLNLEYLVEDGKVRKKTNEELQATLDSLEDPHAIEYLQSKIGVMGLS